MLFVFFYLLYLLEGATVLASDAAIEGLRRCAELNSWISGFLDSFEAMCGDGMLGVSPLLLGPGLRGVVLWPVLRGLGTVVGGKVHSVMHSGEEGSFSWCTLCL